MASRASFMDFNDDPSVPNGYGFAHAQPQYAASQDEFRHEAGQGLPHENPQAAPTAGYSFNGQAQFGYASLPSAGSSDSLDIYRNSQDAFVPSLRGGEDEARGTNTCVGTTTISHGWWVDLLPGAPVNGVVVGGELDNPPTAPGSMNPARAGLLAAGPCGDDPDRDLYEPPPPVSQAAPEQTGANSFPLGSRRQLPSHQGEHGPTRLSPTVTSSNQVLLNIPSEERLVVNITNGRIAVGSAGREWNFNSSEPMPWHVPAQVRSLQIREFSKCKDDSLLGYLAARRVSTGFLIEIDQFIRGHVELMEYPSGKSFLESLTHLPPLDAYQYFLKGYTRPARYIDGIIVSGDFRLPAGFHPTSLGMIKDKELEDFFDGFDYRYDILDRIDREVSAACVELSYGRPVSSGLRRLVCYAVWGNPVDAYKWYEYNYQQEHMPHRYLPEHVILGDLPKSKDYTEPEPSVVWGWKRHRDVRARMARAKDEGVDVIDVLLSEYREALVRKGYRRVDIDSLYARAQGRLDDERQFPRGVDIVDMIMDDTVGRPSAARPSASHSAATRPASRPLAPRPFLRTFSKAAARRNPTSIPHFLKTQATELREVKDILQRLYTQEAQALAAPWNPDQDTNAISNSRASAERRYVNALIRYLRDAKRMNSGQAFKLQRRFTRKRMVGMGQEANRDYLLAMYPRELN